MQAGSEHFSSTALAATLAAALRDSRLSKRAFAEAVGVTHTSINRYLTGGTPALDEAHRIARYLGITLDELVTGDRSEPGAKASIWRERAISAEQRLTAVKAGMTELLKKI
jgi:transcriptional regulator with XRE-family HTH domain